MLFMQDNFPRKVKKEVNAAQKQSNDPKRLFFTKVSPIENFTHPIGFDLLLRYIEKNRGMVKYSVIENNVLHDVLLENGRPVKRVMIELMGKSIRWTVENGKIGWRNELSFIKNRIERGDRLDMEQLALLCTLKAAFYPYRVHPVRFLSMHIEPERLYEINKSSLMSIYTKSAWNKPDDAINNDAPPAEG